MISQDPPLDGTKYNNVNVSDGTHDMYVSLY
jgi:hypothetical protein